MLLVLYTSFPQPTSDISCTTVPGEVGRVHFSKNNSPSAGTVVSGCTLQPPTVLSYIFHGLSEGPWGAGNRLTNARVVGVTSLPVSLSCSIIVASWAHFPSKPPALKFSFQALL